MKQVWSTKRIDIAVLFLPVLANNLSAEPSCQGPAFLWKRRMNFEATEGYRPSVVRATDDGGVILAVPEELHDEGDYDSVRLTKLGPGGDERWQTVIDRPLGDEAKHFSFGGEQAIDGGFLLIESLEYPDGTRAIGLAKTSADGSPAWRHALRGPDPAAVQATLGGEFIVLGNRRLSDDENRLYLAKVEADGDTAWERDLPGIIGELTFGNDVQPSLDGGYVLLGTVFTGESTRDFVLLGTDPTGNPAWDQRIVKPFDECWGRSLEVMGGEGFLITGSTRVLDPASGLYKLFPVLLRTDATGKILWQKAIPWHETDLLRQEADGGYLLASGQFDPSRDAGVAGWSPFNAILKTDSAGQGLIWILPVGNEAETAPGPSSHFTLHMVQEATCSHAVWEVVNWTSGGGEPPPRDCNANGVPDVQDVGSGSSPDCNENGLPDECELAFSLSATEMDPLPVQARLILGGLSADLDGDGYTDLAFNAAGSSPGEIHVYINDLKGSFEPPRISLPVGVASIIGFSTPADLDADGDLDLAGTLDSPNGQSNAAMYARNNGDGIFDEKLVPILGSRGNASATGGFIADFDRDGLLDVASVSGAKVQVLWNETDSETFSVQDLTPLLPDTIVELKLADLDGDAAPDLLLQVGVAVNQKGFVIWNDSSRAFSSPEQLAVKCTVDSITSPAISDFDGDGRLDLSYRSLYGSYAVLLLQDSPRSFRASHIAGVFEVLCEPRRRIERSTPINLDGDGDVDLIASGSDSFGLLRLFEFVNGGDGDLRLDESLTLGEEPGGQAQVQSVQTFPMDLEGDGDIDLVVSWRRADTSHLTVLRSSLDSVRKGFRERCGGQQLPGDCNQDGALDISDAICLLGHLFLGAPAILPCGDGSILDLVNVSLLDVNGDGMIDLSDPVRMLGFLFGGSGPPVLGTECVTIAGCPDNSSNCGPF